MRRSSRSEVDPFIVMDVMDAAARAEAAGQHIIHMEVGQPGTAAPAGARQALDAAMKTDALGYTVALGLPALRARIATLYKDRYSLDIDPDRVVVTTGSSGAFILAFTALFDAGDRVALGEPGYPSYRQILRALDLAPVAIETLAENRFQPVPADLEGAGDLAGLIVASPANPSGTMLDHPAMAALVSAAAARDMAFISDEIYHGIQYDQRPVSALEISDDVYVINSFSKYFSMTGWRVGWMVVPQGHVRTIERLAQNLFICPPHAAQVAALAALDCAPELYQGPLCVTLLGFPFRLGCDSLLLQAGETHDSCGYTVGFIGEGPSRVGGEVNGCEGSAEDVGDCVGYGRVGPRGGGAELRDGPANLARLGVSLQCRGACGPVEPHGTRAHALPERRAEGGTFRDRSRGS